MTRLKYVLALGLAAFAFGCPARSLFPLFAEKDLMILPNGVGTWVSAKGDTVTVQTANDKNYKLTVSNTEGETGQLVGQVGKLGNSWFLDSYPAQKEIDHHLIKTHIISKIRLEGDSLRVASLEGDWLKKLSDTGKLQIPHVVRDNEVILTASTEELQQFVLRAADDPGAFPKVNLYARKK